MVLDSVSVLSTAYIHERHVTYSSEERAYSNCWIETTAAVVYRDFDGETNKNEQSATQLMVLSQI
jgi:hypothetical protein